MPEDRSMHPSQRGASSTVLTNVPWWGWFVSAAVAIAIGAFVWATAFALWPASLVMIVIGVVKVARGCRPVSAAASDPN